MSSLRDLVLTELVRRRRLVADAALEACAAEASEATPVAQLLVARRLLAPALLEQLGREASEVRLRCGGCQQVRGFFELDGAGPPRCPACGAALALAPTSSSPSTPGPPTGRPTSGCRPAPPGPAQPGSSTDRFAVTAADPPSDDPDLAPSAVRHPLSPLPATTPLPAGSPARMAETQPDPPSPDPDVTAPEQPRSTTPDPTTASSAPARERLGPYLLDAELGRGGMGVVYEARAPDGATVAVKVLLGGELASEAQVQRFRREARLASRLTHPGIVGVRDVGRAGERHYLVMEYVEGQGLDQALKRQAFGAERTARLGRDLARALAHAHAQGVIHRDVKPANVLLTRDDRPVLTDFGLAREAEPLGASMLLTREGALVGTPFYMSPEQATGERSAVGPKADVYALGVVLFQLLTGRLPFVAETQLELTEQLLHVDPPRPRQLRPEVPLELEAIVLAALTKDPAARPSAEALADDLERFLAGLSVEALAEGPLGPLVRRAKQHEAALAFLGAVALTVAVLAGGLLVWRGRADDARRADEAAAARQAALAAQAAARQAAAAAARASVETALAAWERVRAAAPGEPLRQALDEAAQAASAALAEPDNAEDPGLLVLRGRALERLGRVREARADYERAALADPLGGRGAEATALLARAHVRAGDEAAAREALARRREPLPGESAPERSPWSPVLAPPRARAWEELVRGLRRLLASDAPGALAHAERALSHDAALPEAHAVEAAAADVLGDRARQRRALEEVVSLDPQDAAGWSNLARVLLAVGESREQASVALERALALEPSLAHALALRAQLNALTGRTREALRDLTRVLEQRPDDPDVLFQMAQLCGLDNQGARAERLLDRLSEVAPADPRPYRLRAAARLRRGDAEGALRALREGLSAAAGEPEAARRLREAFERMALATGQFEAAERLARERLAERADDPDAHTALARVAMQRGDLAAARAALAPARAAAPAHTASWELEVSLGVAEGWGPDELRAAAEAHAAAFPEAPAALAAAAKVLLLSGEAQVPAARALAERALALDPRSIAARVALAQAAALAQEPDEGRRHLQAALELDPSDAEALVALGLLELSAGEPARAELSLRTALTEDPFRPEALEGLGLVYNALGRPALTLELLGPTVDAWRGGDAVPPPRVVAQLVTALLAERREAEALRLLEDLGRQFAAVPHYAVLLAEVHARAGRRDVARELIEAVLAEHPDLAAARALARRLAE